MIFRTIENGSHGWKSLGYTTTWGYGWDFMLDAAQALIDYNEVGNISVIGYYASETVADAVSKGIVQATLEMDAQEIGRLCVEALDEYWSLGRVNNYFNISLSMITQEDMSNEQ